MPLPPNDYLRPKSDYRRCFSCLQDAVRDINTYARFGDVYISVYAFTDAEKNNHRFRPVYESANVDKIFFEFDCLSLDDEKTKEVYNPAVEQSVLSLDDWLEANNYQRRYFFSGGGFHSLVSCVGSWKYLMRATFTIADKLKLLADTTSFGDVARVRRVPNTWNWTKTTKKGATKERDAYCIPVTRDELKLGYWKLHEVAQEPRIGEQMIYGDFPVQLEEYKDTHVAYRHKETHQPLSQIVDGACAEEILRRNGLYMSDLCDAIKAVIGAEKIGNANRLLVIKYFHTVLGLKYEECIRLLQSLLPVNEFQHCMDETQVDCVYNNNRVFFPERFKDHGICPPGCDFCYRMAKMRRG